MADTDETQPSELAELVHKFALELAFVEAGTDNGLLPLNSFLVRMQELMTEEACSELSEAISEAKGWIDALLDSTALFDEPTIGRLTDWQRWMERAVEAVESGQPVPELPDRWGVPCDDPEVKASPTVEGEGEADQALDVESAEPTVVLNLESDRELLSEFINESQEHLLNIEQGVLVLEESPADDDTLNSIFRAFHTFKGGSGFLNLTAIQNLAHELESLLDAARQHQLKITSRMINLILEGGDTLRKFVSEIDGRLSGEGEGAPIVVPTRDLIERLQAVLENGGDDGLPEEEPALVKKSAEQESKSTAAPRGSRVNHGGFVKVDTQKLDNLIDLVGELVISESMVVQDPSVKNLPGQQVARNLAQLKRITNELQRTAMSLRMVPIRATFQKMVRLVRDLAARQEKDVQLVMSGEDTELDRHIVEEISDPLIHMIRNAVDHGLGTPEERSAQSKSGRGTVHLRAFHQGGNIVIQIEDDGNGLNKERILEKATERGLVNPGEVLADKDIYNLIFAPGFSTAQAVSDISGRGVGMDVVLRNIEKLRGKVDIDTVPGEGTTFTIYLPLTLAIIDGMIVSVGGQRYIIPTLSVRESFRPLPKMISTVHERGEMVNVRGRLIPLLRLHRYFDIAPQVTDPDQAIIVVVESGQQSRCLMVDDLLGKQEVVIKNLGETLKRNRALAGGAILGDGRVGLILDVDSVIKLSGRTLDIGGRAADLAA